MTVYTVRQVMCEASGCRAAAPRVDTVKELTLSRVRELASKHGWAVRDGKDYCPDH